jgi:hypothetical protein
MLTYAGAGGAVDLSKKVLIDLYDWDRDENDFMCYCELSLQVHAQRQCLYFCTSKASKLSTCAAGAYRPVKTPIVSVCTFVPVKQVN